MGLQKSPANPKPGYLPSPSPSSGKVPLKGAVFSRSYGVYFPRSSAQVQPRPPDVAGLLHLVEELRERESRLKTQLLEQKLLKESGAILPLLKSEISRKDVEIDRSAKIMECLETENERLRQEVEMLHEKLCEQKREFDRRIRLSLFRENIPGKYFSHSFGVWKVLKNTVKGKSFPGQRKIPPFSLESNFLT